MSRTNNGPHNFDSISPTMPTGTVSSSTTIISSSSSVSSKTENRGRGQIEIVSEKEIGVDLSSSSNSMEKDEKSHTVGGKEAGLTSGSYPQDENHFEVNWDGHNDPENPQNWELWKRGCILMSVSFQTLVVVLYSTSYLSGGPGLIEDFNITSKTTLALGMTVYMFGLAFGPLVLAPMSELYGRRPVYILSLGLSFIFVLPACLAKNYGTILAVRFIGAFVGSVTLANAPGTLGDIFREKNRTIALSCFCIAPMNGPVLGPVIGGVIFQQLGWRWINWIVFILVGVSFCIALIIPETYAPTLLKHKAERLRKETGDERYRSRFCPSKDHPPIKTGSKIFWQIIGANIKRPIIMGITEPVCIFWEFYVAIIYAILYLSFVGYPIVFSELRGWAPGVSGLAFGGIGIGTCIAIALDPLNTKVYNMHKIDPETGKRPPEARIACLCVAAFLSPASMLAFAWTCYPVSIHWVWPILSGIPYGIGNTWIFLYANNYLVESYGRYAASALAGNTVARSILGGILPLFGGQMYKNLGPNWAGTLVGLLAVLIIPIPWGFYKWGKKIRLRSPMLKQLQEEARLDAEDIARRETQKTQQTVENGDEKSGNEATVEEV